MPWGTEVVWNISDWDVCHFDLHMHDGYYDVGDGQKLDVSEGMNMPREMSMRSRHGGRDRAARCHRCR